MPFALTAWVEAMSPRAEESFISLRGESACYNRLLQRRWAAAGLGRD